ncbi:MAG: FecR family protein [Allomuricauda sp.]
MDSEANIKKLLHKFILNQCSEEETEKIIAYFKEHKLSDEFPTVEEVMAIMDTIPEMDEAKANSVYQQIISQEPPRKTINKPTKIRFWRYASVAVVVLSIGLGYLYKEEIFPSNPIDAVPSDQITLQLEDGSTKVISEEDHIQILSSSGSVVGKQSGKLLVYENATESESVVYNTLNVPYGKRFELQLSDGTRVHLNAGTSLKYPINFIEGQHRKVFLTGEALFDVSRDEEPPFILNSDDLNVRVLGTQFNVSSYPEDTASEVVLVEGSVGMYSGEEEFNAEKNTVLEPGYKGTFHKSGNSITTKAVVTDVYTSWIYGGLVFRNMTFNNILKKMERHYNKTIVNENAEISNEIFNASFTDVPIEKILEYIKITYAIDYEINGEHVILK